MVADEYEPMPGDLDPVPGFKALVGHRLVEWRDGFSHLQLNVRERHLNRSGYVHGGVLVTVLDAAAGYTGICCSVPGHVRRCLTVSFSTLFAAPGRPPLIVFRARRLSAARSTFFAEAAAYDQAGLLLCTAQGAYRYLSGSESPEGVSHETTLASH